MAVELEDGSLSDKNISPDLRWKIYKAGVCYKRIQIEEEKS
jgi:hypothetical protein